jgi:hypothetical protein
LSNCQLCVAFEDVQGILPSYSTSRAVTVILPIITLQHPSHSAVSSSVLCEPSLLAKGEVVECPSMGPPVNEFPDFIPDRFRYILLSNTYSPLVPVLLDNWFLPLLVDGVDLELG